VEGTLFIIAMAQFLPSPDLLDPPTASDITIAGAIFTSRLLLSREDASIVFHFSKLAAALETSRRVGSRVGINDETDQAWARDVHGILVRTSCRDCEAGAR
jgi:hypothetical protein